MSEIKVNSVVNSTGDNDSGLDLSTNDNIKFKIANSQKAIIDASGNVGIGTSSPSHELHITGSSDTRAIITSGGSGDAVMMFENASGNTWGHGLDLSSGNYVIGYNASGDPSLTADGKVNIDSSGNVGIGTTSPSHAMHVVTSTDGTGLSGDDKFVAVFQNAEATNSRSFGVKIMAGSNGNDQALTITDHDGSNDLLAVKGSGLINSAPTANNTTGSSANMVVTSGGEFAKSTSSRRYKNTIKDATHGLEDLLKLRSVTFKGNNDGDTIFGGLIAEEVHDAGLTEFVEYDDQNRPDALHYTHMVALCIKAIQELEARLTALESK